MVILIYTGQAINSLQSWRTGFRTAAADAIAEEFSNKELYPTADDIANYVASITDPNNPIFHWREYAEVCYLKYCSTYKLIFGVFQRKSGKYEDPLVLKTFGNAHLKTLTTAKQGWFLLESKKPSTAMALTLASVSFGALQRLRANVNI